MSTEAAANNLRPLEEPVAVTLISAVRWVRRRSRLVHAGLRGVIGLFPQLFAGIEPTVTAARAHLGTLFVLGLLREIAAAPPPPLAPPGPLFGAGLVGGVPPPPPPPFPPPAGVGPPRAGGGEQAVQGGGGNLT